MNTRKVLLPIFFVIVSCLSNCTQADSIWARRDQKAKDLYADDVARNIGDILTIKITEDSKTDNKLKRDLQKDTSRSTTFNGEVGKFIDIGEFGITASSGNTLKSKADYKDERSFVDSISVVVVDILPNSSLIVMGTRSRNIGGDIQNIEISGIVRPSDIAFDNTVRSEQVANFCIVSRNSGVSAPYSEPGWLGRLIDLVWPF
ncbi:MAG: flagellar basal body L-ring protein FlgH [Planctomycetota bacterium]|jgi:flagellar L-ring protein precursor FlgH